MTKKIVLFVLAIVALVFTSTAAHATGKSPKQPPKQEQSVSSESVASAVAGAKSRSSARSRAEGGSVIDESRTTYEADRYPVNSANAIEAYCGAGGVGINGEKLAVQLSGTRDRVCALYSYAEQRTNLGDRYADVVNGLSALLGSLEELDLKGGQGKIAATDTVKELAARVYGYQLTQYGEADWALDAVKTELELDNTFVRRAFVTTFGSLPLLNTTPINPR